MIFFPTVKQWQIPQAAFDASMAEMAQDGKAGNEGIALWLGQRPDDVATVQHVVVLRGPGIKRGPAILMLDAALINDVTDLAIELGACLVGQIHSHGKYFGTNLSPTDLQHGINVPYYLSVVAPDYATRRQTQLTDCGVHIYEPPKGYRRLTITEIQQRVALLPDSPIKVHRVGGPAR